MGNEFHIVVCGSVVPDPLQTLEPLFTQNGPGLKNEMMLPNVLDPWAAHALYEAANLAKKHSGSKVWLVSLGPKPKLQQVMMTIAQKVPFEFKAVDGSSSGFTDSFEVAKILFEAINEIQTLDKSKMLLLGGWQSASRGSGTTMQALGEMFGIVNQFQGVDEITINDDGSFKILERSEGGKHQVSTCSALPMVLGWATGNLPEPPNNPQVGMMNMRAVMPNLQKAAKCDLSSKNFEIKKVELPSQKRDTKIVKDLSTDQIAKEIVAWVKED